MAVLAVIGLRVAVGFMVHDPTKNRAEEFYEGDVEIVDILDGQTLIIRQDSRSVDGTGAIPIYETQLRLIGIDSRKSDFENTGTVEFAKNFLARGQARLRLDRRRKDHYDRLLGYLFINDEMLNIELVRAGKMVVSSFPGDNQSIERKLRKAEAEAVASGRGT